MMKEKIAGRWPIFFLTALIILSLSWYFCSRCIYPLHTSVYVTGYGIVLTVSVLLLSLYVIRKQYYGHGAGSREGWLRAHIYIGLMAVVIMVLHFDFRPAGTFGIFLAVLFFLTIISGIAGSLIYIFVPLSLSKYGRAVKSEEEIKNSLDKYVEEADALANQASEEFRKIYRMKIRPFIAAVNTRWPYLFMTEKEILDRRGEIIESCRAAVPAVDMNDLDMIHTILAEKEKLSLMQAKLGLQKAWLTFHMPLTTALLTATVIHIVTVIYY